MFRLLVLFCVFVLGSVVLAEEIRGKVKSVDAAKTTITLTVGDKDQTINGAKDARVTKIIGKAKKGQPAPEELVTGGLGGLEKGTDVTVTTEKKDGQETARSIKIDMAMK